MGLAVVGLTQGVDQDPRGGFGDGDRRRHADAVVLIIAGERGRERVDACVDWGRAAAVGDRCGTQIDATGPEDLGGSHVALAIIDYRNRVDQQDRSLLRILTIGDTVNRDRRGDGPGSIVPLAGETGRNRVISGIDRGRAVAGAVSDNSLAQRLDIVVIEPRRRPDQDRERVRLTVVIQSDRR